MTLKNAPMILIALMCAMISTANQGLHADEPKRPTEGSEAPDFRLQDLSSKVIELSQLRKQGSVVVVVLRGFPGYQCPLCNRQVGELIKAADQFKAKKALVVLVYPGSAKNLDKNAATFTKPFKMPEGFHFVTDPDFKMINAYGLRWDAPNETAYPSTFVVNDEGKVTYAKISNGHGDRSSAKAVIDALSK